VRRFIPSSLDARDKESNMRDSEQEFISYNITR
jgi:hypothetical protein